MRTLSVKFLSSTSMKLIAIIVSNTKYRCLEIVRLCADSIEVEIPYDKKLSICSARGSKLKLFRPHVSWQTDV